MKLVFAILLLMTMLTAGAQTPLSIPAFDTSRSNYRWQMKPFASVSAGYFFYQGGGASYLSAPVGLALFRPLNAHWTAFAAATVTPVVFPGTRLWPGAITNPASHPYPFAGRDGLGLSTGLQGGLIYTNEDRTFSISGSLHVERNSYRVYPAVPPPKQ